MNDKDKEAFEKWRLEYISTHTGYFKMIGTDDLAQVAWQAACEYKQKEIDSIDCYIERDEKIKKLQAENAKLRECVEFYANKLNWYDNTEINGSEQKAIFKDSEDCLIKSIDKHIVIGGKRARQVLKELEEE